MGEDARLDDFLGDDGEDAEARSDATSGERGSSGEAATEQADATADASASSGTRTDEPEPGDAVADATSAAAGADVPEDSGADSVASDVDDVVRTGRWDGDAVCEDCGEPAPRRWRQDGTLVCADCKSWGR